MGAEPTCFLHKTSKDRHTPVLTGVSDPGLVDTEACLPHDHDHDSFCPIQHSDGPALHLPLPYAFPQTPGHFLRVHSQEYKHWVKS